MNYKELLKINGYNERGNIHITYETQGEATDECLEGLRKWYDETSRALEALGTDLTQKDLSFVVGLVREAERACTAYIVTSAQTSRRRQEREKREGLADKEIWESIANGDCII